MTTTRNQNRPRFQFGIDQLGGSMALFATGLAFVNAMHWLFTQYKGENTVALYLLLCSAVTCCFFAAIGVLFNRGIVSACCGGIVGLLGGVFAMILVNELMHFG